MNQIFFANHIENQFDTLPKGWAFFSLKSGDAELYSGYTANLGSRLRFMQSKAKEGGLMQELWSQATLLGWESHGTALDALIHFKCHTQEHSPEYQFRILPYQDYAYLALHSHQFPFISIQEHTNDDFLYLGPFRSRFFLADVLDLYSRILKLPACETGNYPCSKLESGICRGWCMNLDSKPAESPENSLEKLDSLLKEAFVHPENGILELLNKQRETYFNELEFAKADLLDTEIEILSKYRNWLNFLYIAKNLEFDGESLVISQGRLLRCRFQNREYHFPPANQSYRENEALALDKDGLDESWIIYNHILKSKIDNKDEDYA